MPIKPSQYRPLYLSKNSPLVSVSAFLIDELPVTNAQFYEFTQKKPNFQKQAIAPIFADRGYLKHWQKVNKGYAPKSTDLQQPVVNVSWYAANQYCRTQKKHLPTVEQWEYVAQASTTRKNGSNELGNNWRLIRSDEAGTRLLANTLNIKYQFADNGDINHSNLISILDKEGRLVAQGIGVTDSGINPYC